MRTVELVGQELVFPSCLEGQEDIFWFLDEKLERSFQFLCVYKQLENKKKEWGKVMLKTRKGWLEGKAT